MGLRTINTAPGDHVFLKIYLLRRQKNIYHHNHSSLIVNSLTNQTINNSKLNELITFLHPNASVSNKMAPALTEPLSSANKLSSSAASASPRPSNNPPSSLDNNNTTTSVTTNTSSTPPPLAPQSADGNENNEEIVGSETTLSALENNTAIDIIESERPLSKESNLSSAVAEVTRSSSISNKSKGAFQLAFEKSVAKKSTTATSVVQQKTIAKTTRTKTIALVTQVITPSSINEGSGGDDSSSSERIANEQMGSMCEISSSTGVVDSLKTQNSTIITAAAESPITCNNKISITTVSNIKDENSTSNPIGSTSNFEEQIIAEICIHNPKTISNQLQKNKVAATTTTTIPSSSSPPSTSNTILEDLKNNLLQHMDFSDDLDEKGKTTKTIEKEQIEGTEIENESNTMTVVMGALNSEQSKVIDTVAVSDSKKVQSSPKETTSSSSSLATQLLENDPSISSPLQTRSAVTRLMHDLSCDASNSPNRATILSVQELPPIKTDSTVTASEDDIEERLSQLDGGDIVVTNIPNSNQEIVSGCVTIISGMELVTTTPPRTSQHQLLQLQQNVLTPPTATVISIPVSSLTPQSTTSSSTVGGNLQKDFLKDSGEMDQELEEVLKALKGFDSTTGGDGLCDFGALFSDVYTTLNYEEVNPPTTTATKSNPLKEMQSEIAKKQHTMQRKIDFQIRRLRKLQARYMCKHASEEVSGLFEWSARIANKRKNTDDDVSEPQQLSYAEEKYHPVSTTTMISVVKKIESVANTQQVSLSTTTANISGIPNKKSKNLKNLPTIMGGVSSDCNVVQPSSLAVTVVPTFDHKVTEEIGHISGLLHAEMHEVQNALDSDVTASSSGGESADEMVTYNNQIQQSLSIAKRAAWRYSRDRAAIAARWSWLLSQITDLEIKIRKHSEVYQNMTKHKGPVISEYELEGGIRETATVIGDSGGDGAVSAGGTVRAGTSVNGYRGALPGNVMNAETKVSDASVIYSSSVLSMTGATTTTATDMNKSNLTELPGSCRTRGYLASHFGKRKLFQTTNIHTISKKAARPSTIKCGCQWPLFPCALCTGRSDPTAPRDLPDTMTMSERVALLDPGFHPVLSFPEDIASSIYFEAIARQSNWQNRVMRCTAKSVIKGAIAAQKAAEREQKNNSNLYGGHSKKYYESGLKRKYTKKNRDAAGTTGGVAATTTSTTPLVANKLGKHQKKYQKLIQNRHRHHVNDDAEQLLISSVQDKYEMNDYLGLPSQQHQQQLRNSDLYNHHQAHSSSSYHHQQQSTIKNKSRKLSSAILHQNYHQYHSANGSGGSCSSSTYSNTNSDLNFLHCDSLDGISNCGFPSRSRTSSPTHGGGSSSIIYKHERFLERKNRSSYDIDNIVIPYSIAASTRVEILPYKEIPTPKWRLVNDDEEFLNPLTSLCDDDPELNSPLSMDVDIQKSLIETKDHQSIIDDQQEPTSCLRDRNALLNSFDNNHVVIENLNENTSSTTTTTTTTRIKFKEQSDMGNITFIDSCKEVSEMKDTKEEIINDSEISTKENTISKEDVSDKDCKMVCDDNGKIVSKKTIKSNGKQQEKDQKFATSNENGNIKDKLKSNLRIVVEKLDIPIKKSIINNDMDSIAAFSTSAYCCDNGEDDDDDMEEEDISEEAMILRHERALTEERRKFQTYLKFPWSTRSRANRRIDSRAESSGANTPDPASPAANQSNAVGGVDHDSIPSPAASSTNPMNLLDPIADGGEASSVLNSSILNITLPAELPPPPITNYNCFNNKRSERRRAVSAKKDKDYNDNQRRSSTPDLKETILPYEPLYFPIPDDLFDSMLKMMPEDHQHYSFTEDYQTAKIKIKKSNNNGGGSCSGGSAAMKQTSNTSTTELLKNKSCDVVNNKNVKNTVMMGGNVAKIKSTAGIDEENRIVNNRLNNVDYNPCGGGDRIRVCNAGVVSGVDYSNAPHHHHQQHHQMQHGRLHHHHRLDDDEFGTFTCRNNLLDESDCETTDSGQLDDDPNDPEWRNEPE